MKPRIALLVLFLLTLSPALLRAQNCSVAVNTSPGSENFLSIPSSAALQNPDRFTFETWIRPESHGSDAKTVVSKDGSYRLRWENGNRFSWRFVLNGSNVDLQTPTLSTTVWYHLAARFDAVKGTAELFLDGSSVASSTGHVGSTIDQGDAALIYCSNASGSGRFFEGALDETRIWSMSRQLGQIRDARWYPLDAAAGLEASWHWNGSLLESVKGRSTSFVSTDLADPDYQDGSFCTSRGDGSCGVFSSGNNLSVGSDASLQNTAAMSIEAWVRTNSTDRQIIAKKGDSWRLRWNNERFEMSFGLANGSFVNLIAPTTSSYGSSTWHHVAGTFDSQSGVGRLLVDGFVVESSNGHSGETILQTADDVKIGVADNGTSHNLRGALDELRIWSRARSLIEIQTTAAESLNSALGLEACWHFDGRKKDSANGHSTSQTGAIDYADGIVAPREQAHYPGTGGTLLLESGVGTLDTKGEKVVAPGEVLAMKLSANGDDGLVGVPTYWLAQLLPENSYPQYTTDLYVDVGAPIFFLTGDPPAGMIPNGFQLGLSIPSLTGSEIWSQGISFAASAPNGLISTDAHRFRFRRLLHVDASAGAGGFGTPAAPYGTLEEALNVALPGDRVFVATGSYSEDVLVDRAIELLGGRDPQTWARVPGQYSTLQVSQRGLRLRGIDTQALISGFDVYAANGIPTAVGENPTMDAASIALDARNCSSALVIDDCRFNAGAGASGTNGPDDAVGGSNGNTGGNGQNGAVTVSGNRRDGGDGGNGPNAGGNGGYGGGIPQGPEDGGNGTHGKLAGANCQNRGHGGNGSLCGSAANGSDGGNGDDGSNGNHGVTPPVGGSVRGNGDYRPGRSTDGEAGGDGCGGGGGGGGGAGVCYPVALSGAGGGGGGSGGTGGDGGRAGTEGGPSIAAWLAWASPTFTNCTFIASQGGQGGAGSNGAIGGFGASGGNGGNGQGVQQSGVLTSSGDGGDGGAGGDGGNGGGGAGANGGDSWCVFKAHGSTPPLLQGGSNSFIHGLGGSGGLGGARGGSTTNRAPDGADGRSGDVGS